MARSFLTTVVRVSREMERAERARIREAERQQRTMERDARMRDKLERDSYIASREAETQDQNNRLMHLLHELDTILSSKIGRDPGIDFRKLLKIPSERDLDNDQNLTIPNKPRLEAFLPKPPSVFIRWIPGVMAAFRRKFEKAKAAFDIAEVTYNQSVQRRSEAFRLMQKDAERQNNAIVEFARCYVAAEPDAVMTYFELVLEQSKCPEAFPRKRRIAFVSESKQLVVELELPTLANAVPAVEKYRYVRKTDGIIEVKRSEKQRHALYASAIARSVLGCLYDIFYSDSQETIETVVLNAHVSTIDPATGHSIHPCLISIRTSRQHFLALDLRYVDPSSCLKELKASVSTQPGELLAVRPILEFDMIDPRFVEEADVLSTLDQRPNLMELSPAEFESLITNLFDKMGLDTRLTQPSRDGGVDCVAFDSRPVLGGKVVIQAKRYKILLV